MNDFKDTLLIEEVRQEAFWGNYEGLENQNIPTEKMLFNLQIQNLRTKESTSGGNYALAKNFIDTANQELAGEDPENYVYGRLLQLLNTAFLSSAESVRYNNTSGSFYTSKEHNTLVDSVSKELSELISVLDLSDVIPADLLNKIENTLRKGFGPKQMTMHEYCKIKADIAEQLAVKFLNQNPLYKTIQTGAIYDSKGKQIIEDTMTFSIDTHIAIGGKAIFYDPEVGKKSGIEKTFNDIQDFLTEVEKASKQGLRISLDNTFYDDLQKTASLSTQVKSGISQDILNRSSTGRNAMTLEDTKIFGLEDIWHLYVEAPEPYFEDDAKSKDLMALANYALSQAIGETTLSKNQLYYTTQGFMTASEWMKAHDRMLAFNPNIESLSPDMLKISRPYSFKTPKDD